MSRRLKRYPFTSISTGELHNDENITSVHKYIILLTFKKTLITCLIQNIYKKYKF
jgi:hypothetical protein